MADLSPFEQYYKLLDMLIEKATKKQVAEYAEIARAESCSLSGETWRNTVGRYDLLLFFVSSSKVSLQLG